MAKRTTTRDDRGTQFRRIAPGSQMAVVNPDDDNDNCPENATLLILVAGDITIIPEGNEDGDAVTIPVADGQFLDQVTVRRVKSSGTTADGIYAIF